MHSIPQLPIHIDIIKHRREIDGKSTSAHAVLLAPNNVSVYQYPHDISNYIDDKKVTIAIEDAVVMHSINISLSQFDFRLF